MTGTITPDPVKQLVVTILLLAVLGTILALAGFLATGQPLPPANNGAFFAFCPNINGIAPCP